MSLNYKNFEKKFSKRIKESPPKPVNPSKESNTKSDGYKIYIHNSTSVDDLKGVYDSLGHHEIVNEVAEMGDSLNNTDKLLSDPKLSTDSALRVLRDTWSMLTNEGFHRLLDKIGYPTPYPDIKNVVKITYGGNILEIIEGDKTDKGDVSGHGVYEPRSKKSYTPIDNPKKSRGGSRYHVPKIRGVKRNFELLEKSDSGGAQSEDRSGHSV